MTPFKSISLKARPASGMMLSKVGTSAPKSTAANIPLPSVSKMVINAARAAVDVGARAIKTAQIFVDRETSDKRIHGCSNRNGEGLTCKFFHAESMRCAHPKCGCFLQAKVKLQAMKCPDGVW